MAVYRIGSKTVLFIHVPKTAGSAVHEHLAAHCTANLAHPGRFRDDEFRPKHPTAKVLHQLYVQEMFDHAFMMVRHPVARMVSEYRYQRRRPGLHLSRLRGFGFDIWLQHALWRAARDPDHCAGHFRPQVEYECFNCEVYRHEDGLAPAMAGVTRATGVKLSDDVQPVKVSAFRPVNVSQASLDRIARTYAADFQRYGYAVEVPSIKGVTQSD
jgi:hypothetical protein